MAIAHEREDGERREREPPVEEEEDDRRAEEHERVLDEARDAVGDELVERLDVVREPRDDRAGAVALEVAEREPLEVAEEPLAQVGEDPLADPARQYVCAELATQLRTPATRNAATIQPSDGEVVADDPLVDRELREEGRSERRGRRGEERDDREDRRAAVRLREADEDADAPGRPGPAPVVDLRRRAAA